MRITCDNEIVDAIRILDELGGSMARENCPVAEQLVDRGYVEEDGRDRFGRKRITLTPKGREVLTPNPFSDVDWTFTFDRDQANIIVLHYGQEVWEYGFNKKFTVVGAPPGREHLKLGEHVFLDLGGGPDQALPFDSEGFIDSFTWKGNPFQKAPCSTCNGTGWFNEDDDEFCDTCAGLGYHMPENLRVHVAGAPERKAAEKGFLSGIIDKLTSSP